MKLFNQKLELEAIRAICLNRKDTTLLSSLTPDYFYTTPGKQAFERIKFIARERASVAEWRELLTDPALSEETREILNNMDESTPNVESPSNLLKNLSNYKKSRTLLKISENIQNELSKNELDIEGLFTSTMEDLAEVRTGKDISGCFTRIGENSNTTDLLKIIFNGEIKRFLPSGFKQWDNENGGIPRGKLGIIAATSGAGKSLCANQLCINMSKQDVRICLVPLEMNAVDMLQRFVANITDLDMSELNKLDDSAESKQKSMTAFDKFKKFEQQLNETGTSIDLFNPPEDITMEDLLMILKPFEYDIVIIDYIGLLKGFDNDDQWRKMGAAARYAKIWAETTGTTVLCLAQLNDDMVIRYSKAMKEHADLMWTWNVGKLNDLDGSKTIIKVEPQKGRNQAQKNFYLRVDYSKMSMEDASEEEIQNYEAKHGNDGELDNKKRFKSGKMERPSDAKKGSWTQADSVDVKKSSAFNQDLYSDL